jgi:hypothetical protein
MLPINDFSFMKTPPLVADSDIRIMAPTVPGPMASSLFFRYFADCDIVDSRNAQRIVETRNGVDVPDARRLGVR